MVIERSGFKRAFLAALIGSALLVSAAGADEKRPVPDYDGRPHRTTAGEVALWVPRVLFFPVYAVSEYVVRRPLGWFITEAEKGNWPVYFFGVFANGRHPWLAVSPTAWFEVGFKPRVGLTVVLNDLFAKSHSLALRFSFWGSSSLELGATDRLELGRLRLSAGVDWSRRNDFLFYGLGPSAPDELRSRYEARRVNGGAAAALRLGPTELTAGLGLRDVDFRDDVCCDDPSVTERIAAGELMAPPGWEGYAAFVQRLGVVVDTTPAEGRERKGMRVDLAAEHGRDHAGGPADWLRYGGTAAGYVDLTGRERILSLAATVQLARPLSGGEVPFTEMVTFGGQGPMQGFLTGRLIGESGTSATLRYQWPIWVTLDGTFAAEVGNVFGPDLEGWAADQLRMSFSAGLRQVGPPEHRFEFTVGVGTDTFADGTRLSSFRLAVGGTHGL